MKIVHVTNVIAPDKLGGLERYVRELASEQAASGHQVVVVSKKVDAASPERETSSDGVEIVRYSPPSKSTSLFALKYPFTVMAATHRAVNAELRLLNQDERGIIHAHFPVPALALALARTPYFYTFHAPVYQEIRGERQGSYALPGPAERLAVLGMKIVETFVMRRALRIHTLSEFTAREAQRLGIERQKITVIGGGVQSREQVVSVALQNAGALPFPRLFVARRLVERTGVEQLIQAMPRVKQVFPDVSLGVAGTGPRGAFIESEVERLHLESSVTLLGRISDADLQSRYESSDLVITPTQYLEGFGLSTAEALLAGTPVLVTPVGANPELVQDLDSLLVSRGAGPAALAQGIIDALRNPLRLRQVRDRLREGFATKWTWSVVAAGLEKFYSATSR